jgi:hypothetical protein
MLENVAAEIFPGLLVTQQQPYTIAETADIDAFLCALSPSTGIGAKAIHRSLIYRGHSRASWKLIPASRRKSSWPPAMTTGHTDDKLWNRLASEAAALLTFCQNADRRGLAVPNHSWLTRNLRGRQFALMGGNAEAITSWPPEEALEAMALAQHYRIPTCLLDFSWDPFVAAYFAVVGWIDSREVDEPLCVWIIDDPNFAMYRSSANHSLGLVIPPASDNQTLQAQEGLFIYGRPNQLSVPDAANEFVEPEFIR